jgi:hypothetical protein
VRELIVENTPSFQWRRSVEIVGDRQRVTVKHHSGLNSTRGEASGARSLDRVPDLDLGMTDGLPNHAPGLGLESS